MAWLGSACFDQCAWGLPRAFGWTSETRRRNLRGGVGHHASGSDGRAGSRNGICTSPKFDRKCARLARERPRVWRASLGRGTSTRKSTRHGGDVPERRALVAVQHAAVPRWPGGEGAGGGRGMAEGGGGRRDTKKTPVGARKTTKAGSVTHWPCGGRWGSHRGLSRGCDGVGGKPSPGGRQQLPAVPTIDWRLARSRGLLAWQGKEAGRLDARGGVVACPGQGSAEESVPGSRHQRRGHDLPTSNVSRAFESLARLLPGAWRLRGVNGQWT
jgi:hypothetical protein